MTAMLEKTGGGGRACRGTQRRRALCAMSLALTALTALVAPAGLFAMEGVLPEQAEPVASSPRTSPPQIQNGEDIRFVMAQELFRKGRTGAAIYMLQQLSASEPENVKVLLKLAEMAILAKNRAYAVQVVRKASKLLPEDVPIRLLAMDLYDAFQNPLKEIIVGREILALEPAHLPTLRRLADLYGKQDLSDLEAQTRATLLDLEPDNYENAQALATLERKTGKVWEEVNTQRHLVARFPEKRKHQMRLAYLYGSLGNRFEQLRTLDAIPGVDDDPVARGLRREGSRALRSQIPIQDSADAVLFRELDTSREFQALSTGFEANYSHRRLRDRVDQGLWLNLKDLDYTGTSLLTGTRQVRNLDWQYRRLHEWDGTRSQLLLGLGASHVSVGGSLLSRTGAVLDPADFPFLEARQFGGDTLTARAELQRSLKEGLELRGWIAREPMDDLDAQVRLVTRFVTAGSLEYQWPDSTSAKLAYQRWAISDDNTRQNVQLILHRILWGSDPVHDLDGTRVRFLRTPPGNHLSLTYQADWLDHDRASRLYQSYDNELDQDLRLTGELELPASKFLRIEGALGRGNKVLDSKSELGFGVGYRDAADGKEIVLQYVTASNEVRSGTQANLTLIGLSKVERLQLTGNWSF